MGWAVPLDAPIAEFVPVFQRYAFFSGTFLPRKTEHAPPFSRRLFCFCLYEGRIGSTFERGKPIEVANTAAETRHRGNFRGRRLGPVFLCRTLIGQQHPAPGKQVPVYRVGRQTEGANTDKSLLNFSGILYEQSANNDWLSWRFNPIPRILKPAD